jgi:hypothetical protein
LWLDQVLKEGEHSQRLLDDLPYFTENALKLRPKSGPLEAFQFNPAQLRLHELLEEQKRKTGRVRAIVLKARQLGVSTYVAARFFYWTVNNSGLRTIILGHERRASSNLFQIVNEQRSFGALKASRSKRANCSLRFTGGSLKASTRAI